MVMDDPHDPIVRALRESPPPEPSYWPGRFSQRLRSGEPADGRLITMA